MDSAAATNSIGSGENIATFSPLMTLVSRKKTKKLRDIVPKKKK